MPLADDIRDLAGRASGDLDACHDYFTHTKAAWAVVAESVAGGHALTIRSEATGTVVGGEELVGLAQRYLAEDLLESTFQKFASIFEDFLFGLLRLWLAAHPARLSKKQLDFATVLHAPDKDAITLAVVDRELDGLKYERLAGWFQYLDGLVHLGCPAPVQVEQLAEIKASRDILAHNRGVVNATYLSKSGPCARQREGRRLEIPEPYHRQSWELIRDVIADIASAAIEKA